MKRIAMVICAGIAMIGMSVAMQVTAWGVSSAPTSAVITFEDVARTATLTIPTPACPPTQLDCRWKFFLNEPKLHVDVAILYGTSGTLTIPYPENFCGVIQADAYIGGPPWVPKRGWQHTIEDCTPTPPTTTPPTTMPPTSSTTTSSPSSTTTSTSTSTTIEEHAPVVAATSTTLGSGDGSVAATSDGPQTVTTGQPKAVPVVASTQLPFTGVDVKPLFFMGMAMVGLGLGLMVRVRKGAHSKR